MKLKNLFALITITLPISSCGDPIPPEPKEYNITVESSEYYRIYNAPNKERAGFTVYFDVEVTSPFYELDKVCMNDEEVKLGSLGYSFIMPESDVHLKATLIDVDEYDDPNDHLSFANSVNGKIISLTEEELASDFPYTQKIPLVFDGISSGNYITSIEATLLSKNQEVIPDDAISFVSEEASTSTAIIGGYLSIDLRKVNIGETMLYVHLDPNNASLGTLIKKFTVISPDEPLYETMEVSFSFENRTDYLDEEIFFNISDTLDGELLSFYLSETNNYELSFDYRIGHTYRVSCAVNLSEPVAHQVALSLNEWMGTNIGGVENSLLESDRSGLYILTLETPNVEVPFIIYD